MPDAYPEFTDQATLGQVRAWLREQAATPGGTSCPACTQHCQVYRRKLNANMTRLLVLLYRDYGQEWTHSSVTRDGTGDLAKLRYWKLVEDSTERRLDGGHAGWWRVTDTGVGFLRRGHTVPKYALVYDGRLLELDGDPVTVGDTLGERFDLAALLADGAGVAPPALDPEPERTDA